MDSLTQIVLGAAVGEAVLGKKVGNKAMLYGAIAGTIPDLDTFASYFVDTVTAIELHRSFTHSIIFAIAFAPIFGWLISKIERKLGVGWKNWSQLMFWCLLTHPLLDSFTTWGTQLFWPLDYKLAFKSIFVIDPLYTLPFLMFLILAMFQKRGSNKRSRYNWLGIGISTTYLCLTLILKGFAYGHFIDSLEKQGIFYSRIEIRPSPLNIILWTANVEVEDAYLIGHYSFFDDKELVRFTAYPKNHEYLGDLRKNSKVNRLINISNGWFTITQNNGILYFNDLRFGEMNPYGKGGNFVFSYQLIPNNGELKIEETEKAIGESGPMLISLWERIKGTTK